MCESRYRDQPELQPSSAWLYPLMRASYAATEERLPCRARDLAVAVVARLADVVAQAVRVEGDDLRDGVVDLRGHLRGIVVVVAAVRYPGLRGAAVVVREPAERRSSRGLAVLASSSVVEAAAKQLDVLSRTSTMRRSRHSPFDSEEQVVVLDAPPSSLALALALDAPTVVARRRSILVM